MGPARPQELCPTPTIEYVALHETTASRAAGRGHVLAAQPRRSRYSSSRPVKQQESLPTSQRRDAATRVVAIQGYDTITAELRQAAPRVEGPGRRDTRTRSPRAPQGHLSTVDGGRLSFLMLLGIELGQESL